MDGPRRQRSSHQRAARSQKWQKCCSVAAVLVPLAALAAIAAAARLRAPHLARSAVLGAVIRSTAAELSSKRGGAITFGGYARSLLSGSRALTGHRELAAGRRSSA